MRLNAYKKFPFTAEYWQRQAVQDPESGQAVVSWTRLNDIKFAGGTDNTTRIIIYMQTEPKIWDGVKNIRDRAGKPVVGNLEYSITAVDPVVNVLGYTEGWRAKLSVFEVRTGILV